MDYLFGIDAGGTGTTGIAYSRDGLALGCWRGGRGNPAAAGLDLAVSSICQVLDACLADLGSDCRGALLGVAGVETGDLKARLTQALSSRYAFPLQVVSDAHLVLEARLGAGDGVVVIAGTGSIAWGRRGSQIIRCGGWGHLIADEGSGYAIAIAAIRAMFQAADRGAAPGRLDLEIMRFLNARGLRDVVDYVYQHDKAAIAALLPAIVTCAADGDTLACDLLQQAGRQLAGLAITCCRRLDLAGPRIGLSGSVLLQVQAVRDCFGQALLKEIPNAVLLADDREANRAVISYFH